MTYTKPADCVGILREALEKAEQAANAGTPWEAVVVVSVTTPTQAAEGACVTGRSAFRMVAALDFARFRLLRRLDEANETEDDNDIRGSN